MEDLSWAMEKQVKFIRLYKRYQRLWNPRDKYFRNKRAKISAWSAMGKILEADPEALKKRMKNMMSQFSREKARLKSSFRLDPKAKLPEPRWYLFKEMDFLLEKFDPGLTNKFKEEGVAVNFTENEESVNFSDYEDNKSDCCGDVMVVTPDRKYMQDNPVPAPLVVISNERKWQMDLLSEVQKPVPPEVKLLPPEVKLLPSKRVCQTDRNRAFVEYIYEVLKDLEVGKAADLRHSIHELLHKAEMEESYCMGPSYIKEDLS